MACRSLKLAFLHFWPPSMFSNSESHLYSLSGSYCPMSESPVTCSRSCQPAICESYISGHYLFLSIFREVFVWSWISGLKLCGECFHGLIFQILAPCFSQILVWSRLLWFLVWFVLFFRLNSELFAGSLLSWPLQCTVHWGYIRQSQSSLRIDYFICNLMRRMRDWTVSLFMIFPCR